MKVRCIATDPMTFPVGDFDKRYYNWWIAADKQPRIYEGLTLGASYVVYAIKIYTARPFYFVKYSPEDSRWRLVPALCFEIVDSRVSKLWSYQMRAGEGRYITTVAIKDWIEQPSFFGRLVNHCEPEMDIMRRAVSLMEAEFTNGAEETRKPS